MRLHFVEPFLLLSRKERDLNYLINTAIILASVGRIFSKTSNMSSSFRLYQWTGVIFGVLL